MNSFIKKYTLFIELLTLVMLSLVPLLWFKKGQIVVGLDSGYAVDYIKYFDQRIFTWLASQNFGVDFSAEVGVLPLNSGVPALVSKLGVSLLHVQQVVFVLWFFLILFSMYLLVRYLFPEPSKWLIRLSACILYGFNLHLYSFWLQGEQTILSSYVIFPLFTLFLLKFAQKKESILKTAVILNLIYLFFGSGGVRGVPLIGPVIVTSFVIFFYYFWIRYEEEKFSYIKRFIGLGIAFICIFFFLEAYYVLPFLASFSHEFYSQVTIAGGVDGAISWTKFISTHASFLNLFRLHGDNNWYDKPFLWAWNYLTNPLLIIGGFMIPFLAFFAPLLVNDKKDRVLVLFFVLLALIGIVLAAGAHPPFGFMYTLIMKFLPGFATFRSAWYKFIPIIIFSFSILVGYSLDSLITKTKIKGRWMLSIGAIVLLLGYHFVYFTSDNFVYNKPFGTMVKIPDYIYDFAKYENTRTDDYRTLVVPHSNLGFTIKAFNWGYYGSYPIYPLITDKGFVQYDSYLFNDSENMFVASLYQNLREKDFGNFIKAARIAHIRYILVVEDVAKNYNFAPTENPVTYEEIFSDNTYFKKTWASGKWRIYEIRGVLDSEKIEAQNAITIDQSDYTSIDSLLEKLDSPFIFKSQIDESLYPKLPIAANFSEFTCLTCSLSEPNATPIQLAYSQINPGSILYTFKLQRDESELKKLPKDSSALDALLGLSLKRLGDIEGVKTTATEVKTAPNTEKAFVLLLEYWNEIRKIVNGSDIDYLSLRKIYNYLDFESLEFHKIYEDGYMNSNEILNTKLVALLSDMKTLHSVLQQKLYATDWNQEFIYDVSSKDKNADVYLNLQSLLKDESGNYIFPTYYQIDNGASISAQIDSDGKLLGVNNFGKKLKLLFSSLPNLAQLSNRKISLVNTTQNCLVTPIRDYKWNKKYRITVTSKSDVIPKTIYVKRDYQLLKTQEFTPPSQDFFNPDLTLSPGNPVGEASSFQFTGQPNDNGASVYFCTDEAHDPMLGFSQITIHELIHPLLYTWVKQPIKENNLPKISLKRINPSLYTVNVRNATDPFILNFKEAYSPNWQAKINGKKVDDHFKINGYANAWVVDKKGDYSIVLTFYTQDMFYKGLIMTCVTFVLLVMYLVKSIILTHEKNKS